MSSVAFTKFQEFTWLGPGISSVVLHLPGKCKEEEFTWLADSILDSTELWNVSITETYFGHHYIRIFSH